MGAANSAAVLPDQTANVVTRAIHRAAGEGAGDAAAVLPDQAADVVTRAIHHAGGVGGADTAAGVVFPDQAADIAAASDRAGGVGTDDAAAVVPDQAADIAAARNAGTDQPDVAQCRAIGGAEQPLVIFASAIDEEAADRMAKAVEDTGEGCDG